MRSKFITATLAIVVPLSAGMISPICSASIAQSKDSSSGDRLYAVCGNSGNAFDQGLCDGFIGGVLAGVQADHGLAGRTSAICTRPSVTNGQIIAVVTQFLQENPDIRDQDAGGIALVALARAFPCPKAP